MIAQNLSGRDKKLWEEAASDFIRFVREVEADGSGDYLRNSLLIPTIIGFSGDLSGKKVLDAGCGEGILSEGLSQRGADVIGVDSSTKMIDAAQGRVGRNRNELKFIQSSIDEAGLFPPQSFDLIIVNMVFQEMDSIEGSFANLLVSLKSGGKIIISVLHPCFDMNDSQRVGLGTMVRHGVDYAHWNYEIYSPYTESRRYERDYTFSEHPVAYYFRPISEYINLFINNDVQLSGFFEPTLPQKDIKPHLAHAYFVPRFLILGGETR